MMPPERSSCSRLRLATQGVWQDLVILWALDRTHSMSAPHGRKLGKGSALDIPVGYGSQESGARIQPDLVWAPRPGFCLASGQMPRTAAARHNENKILVARAITV